jgi:hypothetical protein
MNPIYFDSDGLRFLLPKNAHPLVEGLWLRLTAEELDQRLHGRLTATFTISRYLRPFSLLLVSDLKALLKMSIAQMRPLYRRKISQQPQDVDNTPPRLFKGTTHMT